MENSTNLPQDEIFGLDQPLNDTQNEEISDELGANQDHRPLASDDPTSENEADLPVAPLAGEADSEPSKVSVDFQDQDLVPQAGQEIEPIILEDQNKVGTMANQEAASTVEEGAVVEFDAPIVVEDIQEDQNITTLTVESEDFSQALVENQGHEAEQDHSAISLSSAFESGDFSEVDSALQAGAGEESTSGEHAPLPNEELVLASVVEANTTQPEAEEEEEGTDEPEEDAIDFPSLSRKDLYEHLEALLQGGKGVDKRARRLKDFFDEATEQGKQVALQAFTAGGGAEEDFEFRKDVLSIKFDETFRALRDRRKKELEEQDKTKKINLMRKQQLLELLRKLVEEEESTGSLEELKKIQEEWRSIRLVPQPEGQELYNSYMFLIERYYNKRTQFNELKDLDRKKNLEFKKELLERAQRTLEEPVIIKGLRDYQKIFDEFRHIGPAPREENDALWTRMRQINSQLIEKKKSHDDAQRAEAEIVAAKRQVLIEELAPMLEFDSEKVSDWQKKTDELNALTARYKETGTGHRERLAEVSKNFWGMVKKFFGNRDAFFKKLDKERSVNLKHRREILKQVQALPEQENRNDAQTALKDLLAQWKAAGPVATKYRESLNQEFSTALDKFFETKKAAGGRQNEEQAKNLESKKSLISRLKALGFEKMGAMEEFSRIQEEFWLVGFVPIKLKESVNAEFKEALIAAADESTQLSTTEKSQIKQQAQRGPGGNRGFDRERSGDRDRSGYGGGGRVDNRDRGGSGAPRGGFSNSKGGYGGGNNRPEGSPQKIALEGRAKRLEQEVNTLKTNIDFLANSRTADKLKEEYTKKIENAELEIKSLKDQLQALKSEEAAKAQA